MKKSFLILSLVFLGLAMAQVSQAQEAPGNRRIAAKEDQKKDQQAAYDPAEMKSILTADSKGNGLDEDRDNDSLRANSEEMNACTWVYHNGRWHCEIYMVEGHTGSDESDDADTLAREASPEEGGCHYVSINGKMYCMNMRLMK